MKPETIAVHAGFHHDPAYGAVMPPIYQVSTYAQESPGQHKGYDYSRGDNPTRTPLQEALAALEGAAHGLAFSSGMAATDCWLNTLKTGDHVVAVNDLYGGTMRLFNRVAIDRGISFTYADLRDPAAFEQAIQPNTKWVWFETPTNPTLKIVDIAATCALAKAKGLRVGVDNTFMSPILQSPLALGADLVMHSMTKYINGHSDVIMGALMTNDAELYQRLKFIQLSIGAVPAPFDCFLALRGIRTLAIRMKQHCLNGAAVAEFLSTHPKVERVMFPGLPSDPGHDIAKRQNPNGFGGMLSFVVTGGLEGAKTVLENTQIFKLAESLGGVESLIEHPGLMTHASLGAEVRKANGIEDGLIRISCGIEHPDDLIADLDQAIRRI